MKVLRWLDHHVEELFLSVFLLTLIILTSANVVLRYVFNSGLTWSDEICKYCLIFSGFISISCWIRHKSGICVDALAQVGPGAGEDDFSGSGSVDCAGVFSADVQGGHQLLAGN